MATPIHTPRINNNDDSVQVVALHVRPGDRVRRGDVVAEVETDKSVCEVTAEHDGFVLEIRHAVDDRAEVGSVLMWLGERADEPIPEQAEPPLAVSQAPCGAPTAGARVLLRRYGLGAAEVPAAGERLTTADVEAFAMRSGLVAQGAGGRARRAAGPDEPGTPLRLSAEEEAMLATVSWHRDHAAAAYLEIEYDPAPWDALAKAYAGAHRLMVSPLLPLMAYRLVRVVAEHPRANSTVVGERRHQYERVNLGFTVQAGTSLYLTVVRDAAAMTAQHFVRTLGEVQRNAMAHRLPPDQTRGATVAFTSMSRWNVTRHLPILPPHTSLIVAHAATAAHGRAVLGASYDHRVLSGFDVVSLLREVAKPPDPDF
jgi:pyruvate/2-oxoglutarate dehydrogenase complex dihydrolipoamide acyltransferase (E2) component